MGEEESKWTPVARKLSNFGLLKSATKKRNSGYIYLKLKAQ